MESTKKKNPNKVYLDYDSKKLEENLEEIYEARRAIVEEKQNQVREKR